MRRDDFTLLLDPRGKRGAAAGAKTCTTTQPNTESWCGTLVCTYVQSISDTTAVFFQRWCLGSRQIVLLQPILPQSRYYKVPWLAVLGEYSFLNKGSENVFLLWQNCLSTSLFWMRNNQPTFDMSLGDQEARSKISIRLNRAWILFLNFNMVLCLIEIQFVKDASIKVRDITY